MQKLINFISAKNPKESAIFKELQCSKEEAILLQRIIYRYVSGIEEVAVLELLQEIYGSEPQNYLNKLELIQNLIEMDWIVLVDFENQYQNNNEHSKLEILSSEIAPSNALLKLLENGNTQETNEDIKPYSNQIEYLQDQFERIDLMQRITLSKAIFSRGTKSKSKLRNKLIQLEALIDQKLSITKDKIDIEEFFKREKLNRIEKIIFLALLKEEYRGGEGPLRNLENLIDLVSSNEAEKIKNRLFFESNSKLLKEGIIEYEESINVFGEVSKTLFINEEIIQDVLYRRKKSKKRVKLKELIKRYEQFEYIKPKKSLDEVVLPPSTREALLDIIKQLDPKVSKRLKEWGFKKKEGRVEAKIIFHGPPGTGKSATAIAFAKELKRDIISLDCSKILSMYVGESEKNVRKIFDDFKEIAKNSKKEPILLLNEADQFFSSRVQGANSSVDKMHNQMQNIFLEQLESFEGVLIATTNLIENIDPAFSRRFDRKIEFKRPNFAQRVELWKLLLPKNAPYEENLDINKLAAYDLSGGEIEVVIKNCALKVAQKEKPIFTTKDFILQIEAEKRGSFDSSSKNLGFKI